MNAVPQFDRVYVISDLHLGGATGFQIFGSSEALVWLLDSLRGDAKGTVALVINGDFVDFLAEEPARHFDPHGAIDKLERIATKDAKLSPVFAALGQYLACPHNTLYINLGNHDLELALPWVRDRLAEILLGKAMDARHRLVFVLDGTGVRLNVGKGTVLCLHGNEVDSWNFASYETIRTIARDIQFGQDVKDWVPNPGARMVIDAMNHVKRQFPFVDLLKPETEAVTPALRACDVEGKAAAAWGAARALGWKSWASVWKPEGMLSTAPSPDDDGRSAVGRRTATMDNQPVSFAAPMTHYDRTQYAEKMLIDAETMVDQDVDALAALAGTDMRDLGWIFKESSEEGASENLREALKALDKDRSFEIDEPDECFEKLDEKVANSIDFIVAGHTHLRRSLPRTHGTGHYFNSGTWARLIQITPAQRKNKESFLRVFKQLKGDMATLDDSGLASNQRTVVQIWREPDDRVLGQLFEVLNKNEIEKRDGVADQAKMAKKAVGETHRLVPVEKSTPKERGR